MRLTCIEGMMAHWGAIFEEGKEYEVTSIEEKNVGFVTDYDRYWEKIKLIAGAREWIAKGYTKENLREVIPGYITLEEVKRLYVKEAMVPHATIEGSDGNDYWFCLTSYEEFYRMGAAVSKSKSDRLRGKPAFDCSLRVIDENFDYAPTRREIKIRDLGI